MFNQMKPIFATHCLHPVQGQASGFHNLSLADLILDGHLHFWSHIKVHY